MNEYQSQLALVSAQKEDLAKQLSEFKQTYSKKMSEVTDIEEELSKLKQNLNFFKQESNLY